MNNPDRFIPYFGSELLEHVKRSWAIDSWNIDTNKWKEIVQKGKDSASSKFPAEPIEIFWEPDSLAWLMDGRKPDVVVVKKRDGSKKIRHSMFVNAFLLQEALGNNVVCLK